MDSETEDLYFQKLEEYIQDEDKTVTIPYLARKLEISIQNSQHVLSKYIRDQRKLKPNELALTYILTGNLTNGGMGVIFVKEDDLDEKRSIFKKIESEVLFSAQKSKKVDINVIALVDNVASSCDTPLVGSIVSQNCVKRVLKVKKLPTPPPSTIKGKSSFFLPKTESSSSIEKSEAPKQEPKPKQNGIADLFSRAPPITKENKSTNHSKQMNKGGLSAFLSKGSGTLNTKGENEVKKENKSETDTQPNEFEGPMDFSEQIEEDLIGKETDYDNKKEINKEAKEIKTEVKEEIKKEVKETKGKKSKNKRQREKSEEKFAKKRKRIIERNDSESDDLFENDDEDIVEKSDEEERPPSPAATLPLAPKNKIRKAVDNTYMDEEGFIVTKTEYIYESAPEDDEVVPIKKNNDNKPKLEKKTNASSENDISPKKEKKNKKGKKNIQNQPTLMNFFNKK